MRKASIRSILGFAAFVILVLVIARIQGSYTTFLTIRENDFVIGGPRAFERVVPYEAITSVELEDAADWGECLSGGNSHGCWTGRWKNERWGEYDLCAVARAKNCIVVTTEEVVVVFSYESTASTQAFCDALRTLLAERGVKSFG